MTSGERILARDMDARRGIGGARPAGDEADAGLAGHLADRFGHHAGATLLAADGDGEIGVVERIEHRQIALARHAEDVAHAVDVQLVDQNLGGGAHIVLGAHGRLLGTALNPGGVRGVLPWRSIAHVRDRREPALRLVTER